MMDKGVILLDVDGPLNPWAAKSTRRPEGYVTHRLRPAGWEDARKPLRVWLRPDHGRWLRSLAEATGWELVWATTWQHEANRLISPRVGLPELPVIDFDGHPGTTVYWKFAAVRDYIDDRPMVWFDDDFDRRSLAASQEWFRTYRDDLPTMLYYIDPRVGLTESNVASVQWWIEDVS